MTATCMILWLFVKIWKCSYIKISVSINFVLLSSIKFCMSKIYLQLNNHLHTKCKNFDLYVYNRDKQRKNISVFLLLQFCSSFFCAKKDVGLALQSPFVSWRRTFLLYGYRPWGFKILRHLSKIILIVCKHLGNL